MIFLNFNAYRAVDPKRIAEFANMIEIHKASVITIQEIHVQNCLKIFSGKFQVFVNLEHDSKTLIGICTLIRKDIKVLDYCICQNGRIIGIKLSDLQIWNIYPKSGTNNKREREIFFREVLSDMLHLWKDSGVKNIITIGDFNCTHTLSDSLNNKNAHLQQGLIKFMEVHNLKDDYLHLNGHLPRTFSRVTNLSSTRIDTAISNISSLCQKFEYITFKGLDHKIILCEYSISFSSVRPKHVKYHREWVINKSLLKDDIFINGFKRLLVQIDNTLHRMDGTLTPSYIWNLIKNRMVDWAKSCHSKLVKEKKEHYFRLIHYYHMALEDIANGIDCYDELSDIILVLNELYREKIVDVIKSAKYLEVKDETYDVIKKQKEMKFEGGSKIEKLKIDDKILDSDLDIIEGVEQKMKQELETDVTKGYNDDFNDDELDFLKYLPKLDLDDEVIEKINSAITEEEVTSILGGEVDLDSSPGLDGITYRFIRLFWGDKIFKKYYLAFLNYIKDVGDFADMSNIGLMVLKNKKGKSIDYSKKRKLTKINKDLNLLGKVWSNRCKLFIMDEIIPRNQFVCSSSRNIINELCEIRDINMFLQGKNGRENDGSILCIDYKNAFRSIHLHWFSFVMRYIGFPRKFIDWFFNLYKNLGIIINVNGFRSNVIKNQRGLLEGNPPSMIAYVIATIPLINALEAKLTGIKAGNRTFLTKNFADDQKILIGDPSEAFIVQDIVFAFEKVSGVMVHRDKSLKKCNVLPFGNHRKFQNWPDWVNVSDKIKIIGGIFGNSCNIEYENSQNVKNKVLGKLFENWGMKGSLMQKSYFVNVFCLTKLNYICQVFRLQPKHCAEIKKFILKFIYCGENERPVQSLNFRKASSCGLNIVDPEIKASSLLTKTSMREIKSRGISLVGNLLTENIYGQSNVLLDYLKAGQDNLSSKQIYDDLLLKSVSVNGSLIPTRIEKKVLGVKWSFSYKNFHNLKFVTSLEKEFAWKMIQDLVPVNGRLHRKNSDKRCLREIQRNVLCGFIQDRSHAFISCPVILTSTNKLKSVLFEFTDKTFDDKDLLYLSFKCKNKELTFISVWLIIKYMFMIFHKKVYNYKSLFDELRKEVLFLISEKFIWKLEYDLYLLEDILLRTINGK